MMGRAPSFGMGKLESMELPDAVAAVVRHPLCPPCKGTKVDLCSDLHCTQRLLVRTSS